MIKTVDLTKSYGTFKALDQINIHVKKGSVYGMVGPNGAGKTTLLKIMTGIFRQNQGQVFIDGQIVEDHISLKQRIRFIPDELYYFPMSTIKDMADFYEDMFDVFDRDRFVRIQALLKIPIQKKISQLSKGMKKQVAFWLAICTKPDVMILDEPVDGLDPVMRRQIWSLLLQDVAERNMTVVVSSHNLRELEDVCDYVGILHEGKLLLERDLDEMKSDIHKIQVAFENSDVTLKSLNPLKAMQVGSVHTIIVRGLRDEIEKSLSPMKPVLVDFIPLTLEEIFIYEIGGEGYEVTNLIL